MMFHLLGVTLCFALFPLVHLHDVCYAKGMLRDVPFYNLSSLCDFAVNYHLEYDKHAVLREGNLANLLEMDSCESLTISGLQYIESGGFRGLEKLTTLIIRQDFFDIIEHGMFKYLDNMKNLVIGGNYNKIFKLENEAFHNLGNLVTLTLSNNSISVIQADVFKGLENVTDLDLSYNELQKLGEFSFNHLYSLRYINLRKNKLIRVSRKAFYNLTNLQEIDLQDNLIKAIEEPLFGIDEIIVAIDLTGNPLRCDCRMEWISSWLNMSARKCYGKCDHGDAPEDVENLTLSYVYNSTHGPLQCPTNNSVITQKKGTLLELPCTLVDCTWTTPDGRLLSEHGERQGPYFLTNYDALIIDTTHSTNTTDISNDTKFWFNGIYNSSSEDGSHVGEVDVQIPFPTVRIVSAVPAYKRLRAVSIALSVLSTVLVLISLIYIVTKHDNKFKVDWSSCWKSEENTPLVSQDSFYQSGSENTSQNSLYYGDKKFKKSPSFENDIDKNIDHSGSYNSNAENEYLKAQSFEQSL